MSDSVVPPAHPPPNAIIPSLSMIVMVASSTTSGAAVTVTVKVSFSSNELSSSIVMFTHLILPLVDPEGKNSSVETLV